MGVARSLLQFFGRTPEDLASERYRSNEILDCFDRATIIAAELEAFDAPPADQVGTRGGRSFRDRGTLRRTEVSVSMH